ANYAPAPSVAQSFPIAQAGQSISFGPLPGKTYGDAPFGVNATASSGLSVSFAVSGNCSVTGATVTLTGAGTCTVTASQAGNATSPRARAVAQSCVVPKATQPLAFARVAARV